MCLGAFKPERRNPGACNLFCTFTVDGPHIAQMTFRRRRWSAVRPIYRGRMALEDVRSSTSIRTESPSEMGIELT